VYDLLLLGAVEHLTSANEKKCGVRRGLPWWPRIDALHKVKICGFEYQLECFLAL
jgi:hypothetical protein